jgi:hypothetical protein
MNNYIISSSLGGLSNRIKCLISSMKLAEITKRELILYWPKDPSCNCNFSDLFDNDIKEISRKEIAEIIKSKRCEIYLENLHNFKGKKRFVINFSTKIIGFRKKDLHLMFYNIPKDIIIEITNYLSKLKIKKDILKIVEEFSKKNFTKKMVGVHIRKGDFQTVKSKVGLVSSEDKFIEEIGKEIKLSPRARLLLATEDKETENKFKRIFSNKIISYPKKTKKREEEGSVKEALIELLLLSKCRLILGNFGSTFTEMAWFLGDCKPKVRIVIEEKSFKEHIKLVRERESVINIIKKLVYKSTTPLYVRLLGKV